MLNKGFVADDGEIRAFKHFSLSVPSLTDAINALEGRSVKINRLIDYSDENHVFKVCFIKEPEGNVIEFMEGY
jgi:hypothetical protein